MVVVDLLVLLLSLFQKHHAIQCVWLYSTMTALYKFVQLHCCCCFAVGLLISWDEVVVCCHI